MSEQHHLDAPSVHSSQAEVWHLKQVAFGPANATRPIKIITQNFSGPCSFIAICNILVLRGQIEILPHDRTTVSYEFLSQLVGEYLLTSCPDIDISAALSIMPSTTKGLDLNPQFTSTTAFSPASDAGELALFAQAGIPLVHGWLVDPESPEAEVMLQIRDYDSAVTLIADADYITSGRLLGDVDPGGREGGGAQAHPADAARSSSRAPHRGTASYSDDDRRKIEHAIVARHFLDATRSQLTYHGLFQLAATLEPGSLAVLFRNAHLSVVYKSHPVDRDADPNHTEHVQDAALYALVTDDAFLYEPSVVWERLEDVDGGSSTFVDSHFHPAVPVGGDVAGQSAEAALRQFEMEAGLYAVVDPVDQALAKQLQAEEDERAREVYARRQGAVEQRRAREERARRKREGKSASASEPGGGKNKKKNCIVM